MVRDSNDSNPPWRDVDAPWKDLTSGVYDVTELSGVRWAVAEEQPNGVLICRKWPPLPIVARLLRAVILFALLVSFGQTLVGFVSIVIFLSGLYLFVRKASWKERLASEGLFPVFIADRRESIIEDSWRRVICAEDLSGIEMRFAYEGEWKVGILQIYVFSRASGAAVLIHQNYNYRRKRRQLFELVERLAARWSIPSFFDEWLRPS